MKALLVGSGGREHAIARSLAGDAELHAAVSNLNPGIADLAETVREVDVTSPDEVVEYALDVEADVAVVGPEAPLQAGVVDALEDAGVYGFGPKRDEARIETDKAWARRFMTENEVPGAPEFEVFGSREAAADYVEVVEGDVAVKPRGLTGGKGVRVTGDQLSKQEAG
ncbi:MAG: phosphoribosylamine--glycine ligase, partial [Halobacteriota archaeon]